MALDSNKTGASIADFVKNSAPAPGEKITDDDLETMWKGIMAIIYGDVASDAVVSTTGVTGVGGTNGPYPITAQPGVIS